tara:strand:- start:123 stop:386 length:264 start_codon:yes stop_codon:yes gene_type:complete
MTHHTGKIFDKQKTTEEEMRKLIIKSAQIADELGMVGNPPYDPSTDQDFSQKLDRNSINKTSLFDFIVVKAFESFKLFSVLIALLIL